MFAYCNNNPVMGYDPLGTVNWGGVFTGIAIGILAVGAAALTIATAGAAAPLAAAAITTLGTVATAALAEASVVTMYGAACEISVVYDITAVAGNDRGGISLVYDYGEGTSDLYLHTGKQSQKDVSMTFGSGFVYNYDKPGDYAGEFVDVSMSGKAKGASLGVDYCTSPGNFTNGYKDSHAFY